MPSRDDQGKRLSGAQQRKRAARVAAGMDPDLPPGPPALFANVEPPPIAQGVQACLLWANDLALRCAIAALDPDTDPERTRLLLDLCSTVGALKDKASQSEKACKVRTIKQQPGLQAFDPDRPPLGDAMAAPAWSYYRTCAALYHLAHVDELPDEWRKRYYLLGSAVGTCGYLKEKHQTQELVEELRVGKKRR